jgi:hypothetical protein
VVQGQGVEVVFFFHIEELSLILCLLLERMGRGGDAVFGVSEVGKMRMGLGSTEKVDGDLGENVRWKVIIYG